MKPSYIVTIVFSMSLVAGCATTPSHFYGLKMDSISSADRLIIKRYSIVDGVININYRPSEMDSNISAWGEISGGYIYIRVHNESNAPIPTNYFGDSFSLITTDRKMYRLEKEDILSYPKESYINPGSSIRYSMKLPFYGLTKEQVSKVICELGVGVRTLIVLVPLPYPSDQLHPS